MMFRDLMKIIFLENKFLWLKLLEKNKFSTIIRTSISNRSHIKTLSNYIPKRVNSKILSFAHSQLGSWEKFVTLSTLLQINFESSTLTHSCKCVTRCDDNPVTHKSVCCQLELLLKIRRFAWKINNKRFGKGKFCEMSIANSCDERMEKKGKEKSNHHFRQQLLAFPSLPFAKLLVVGWFFFFFAHNFTLNFHQLWIRFLAPEVNKDSHFPVASAISRRGSGKASVKNFINHWLGILADDGGSLMEQDNFSHPHTEPGQRKASFVNFSWNRKVCRWRETAKFPIL